MIFSKVSINYWKFNNNARYGTNQQSLFLGVRVVSDGIEALDLSWWGIVAKRSLAYNSLLYSFLFVEGVHCAICQEIGREERHQRTVQWRVSLHQNHSHQTEEYQKRNAADWLRGMSVRRGEAIEKEGESVNGCTLIHLKLIFLTCSVMWTLQLLLTPMFTLRSSHWWWVLLV